MGLMGHRTGYNVLYGDGVVSFYGDPQERIIWHTEGRSTPRGSPGGGSMGLGMTWYYGQSGQDRWSPLGGREPYGEGYFEHTPFMVWHYFDAHMNIDVPNDYDGAE